MAYDVSLTEEKLLLPSVYRLNNAMLYVQTKVISSIKTLKTMSVSYAICPYIMQTINNPRTSIIIITNSTESRQKLCCGRLSLSIY